MENTSSKRYTLPDIEIIEIETFDSSFDLIKKDSKNCMMKNKLVYNYSNSKGILNLLDDDEFSVRSIHSVILTNKYSNPEEDVEIFFNPDDFSNQIKSYRPVSDINESENNKQKGKSRVRKLKERKKYVDQKNKLKSQEHLKLSIHSLETSQDISDEEKLWIPLRPSPESTDSKIVASKVNKIIEDDVINEEIHDIEKNKDILRYIIKNMKDVSTDIQKQLNKYVNAS
ncbi:unnamed protein product [Gordionus sp. m RMFG-2023]